MKKLATISVLALSLVLIAALLAILFWKRATAITAHPAELLPADTLFVAELVDLHQSAMRWPGTELNKLFEEPEVKAFLEKPMARWEAESSHKNYGADLLKTLPRQAFLAIPSLESTAGGVKTVGGFSFAGDRGAAERLLAEPRKQLKEKHPAGRAEIRTHGKIEVQTYTDGPFVFAEAFHKHWYLAATDLALLESTLDRLDRATPKGAAAAGTLAADETYRKAGAGIPADPELRLFGRVSVLADRLATAMVGMEGMDGGALKQLQEVKAIAASTKIDGGQWRDTIFSYAPEKTSPTLPPITRSALALSTPDTGIFYSTQIDPAGLSAVPAEMLGNLPFIGTLKTALAQQNGSLKDLAKIFGDEISLLLQNGKGGKYDGVIAISLRDPQKAAQLADALASPASGPNPWKMDASAGTPLYSPPDAAFPVVALTNEFWLLSWSAPTVSSFVQRGGDTPRLDSTAAFKSAAATVAAPSTAFAYIDFGAVFDAAYTVARPLLAISLAGNPEAGAYIDAGKLPSGGVVARHLGTTVISQSTRPDGNLWESRGNLSTAQFVLGGGAALVNFALTSPMLKQMLPSSLPGMLNLSLDPQQQPSTSLSDDPTLQPEAPAQPTPGPSESAPAPTPKSP